MQTSRPSDMSVPGRLAAAVGAVSLTGLVALALVGCTGGELPGPRPQATVLVEQPAAGALVSAGTHDVVLLVHQAGEYTLGEVRAQVARLQAAQATLAPLPAGRVAMAVVTASAGTQLRQPLTADPAVSAAALAAAAALAPEGTATLADGLRAALAELGGERARREALPLVLHLAGAGPAVPLELAGELADAGVVVVHLGGEQAAAALWPPEHPGQLAIDPATLEVPGRRALSGVAARLLLSHDPLTVRVRTLAADRLRVRLLGEGGMALLDLEGKGPLFEAIADLPDGAELLPLQVHVQAWSARGGAASELRAEAIELPLVRPPAISMVEPARAVPGETVVLRGRFFSTRPDGNTIELGSMLVQPSVQAKHRLEFVLPEGAPDRQVRVLADDQPSAWATLRVDSDGDTLPDDDERALGTDPTLADTDGDGFGDALDACPVQHGAAGNVDGTGCSFCGNGILDGGEGDIDCGGRCPPCSAGQRCANGDADCAGGRCREGLCLPAHCSSGTEDGDEADVDCGGSCPPCGDGYDCSGGAQCESGVCLEGRCRPAHCRNGISDGSETDLDCGGPCPACPLGSRCLRGVDCSTRTCRGEVCVVPACDDGLLDGDETDIDCGGPSCHPCPPGFACREGTDCATSRCEEGRCADPACDDGRRNSQETDIDCGGFCPPCAVGKRCALGDDCAEQVCREGFCQAPSCADSVANGEESDVDCGGVCARCPLGAACSRDADCASQTCREARCVLALCTNGVQDPDESDRDCGGAGCASCAPGRRCLAARDCTSRVCGAGGRCAEPTCADGVHNGGEADVDCAGRCPFCADGMACRSGADCRSRSCRGGRCAVPRCDDGASNQDETDVDCGGSCSPCPVGARCLAEADCRSGECFTGRCTSPSCENERQDGDETGVDCGGGICPGCAAGEGCAGDADCASSVCAPGQGPGVPGSCVEPTCADSRRNGEETGPDCGGPTCDRCADGAGCRLGRDCASSVCRISRGTGTCQPPSCSDHVRNGAELDVDCGAACGPCRTGQACLEDAGCASGVCEGEGRPGAGQRGACAAPSCSDGVRNGEETASDCGGGGCPACAAGLACRAGRDCASGVCSEGWVCLAPTCVDTVVNGGETGPDCGGATACPRCADGLPCRAAGDCTSSACDPGRGRCLPPACDDGVVNGTESGTDCGGGGCASCPDGEGCTATTDCASGVCPPAGGRGPRRCAAARCDDGVANGDEAGPDCGGSCPGCALGAPCRRGADCSSTICHEGRCAENTCLDGVRSGRETDVDCGGPCTPCADGGRCTAALDCASRFCAQRECRPAPSCAAIARADPTAPDGAYSIKPPGLVAPVRVRCDMSTDQGGWTLVAASGGAPPDDAGAPYSAALAGLDPAQPATGLWDGLRGAAESRPVDMRFTCRLQAPVAQAVDLSFYGVVWYQAITAGSEADSCFLLPDRQLLDRPARRDNLSGAVLGLGVPWGEQGQLVGEASCDDPDSFTVDFRDAGLDGNERDGTDWGEDDGRAKCGSAYAAPGTGAWFVWVRERLHHCYDGLLGDGETGVDCGGAQCEACAVPCVSGDQCDSGICDRGYCARPRCDDGVANGAETDRDCGGGCPATCPDGAGCALDEDCSSAHCHGAICRPLGCASGTVDPGETDVDCGGLCPGCPLGGACGVDGDCASGACREARCIEEPCRNGQRDPGETGVDCGGPRCPSCPGGAGCAAGADCESGRCADGTCAPLRLCDDLWASEDERGSGTYQLDTAGGGGADQVEVACDMEVDGGGWTLVAASLGAPPRDEAGPTHEDLARAIPRAAHAGIWDGLRDLLAARSDLRFACAVGRPGEAGYRAVDLSFYGVGWYGEITAGADSMTCFSEGLGDGFDRPAPRRRDNLGGRELARGTPWRSELEGFLVGEDSCDALDDFTVDLEDRGMDGNEADGSDWGLDDGVAKCGAPLGAVDAMRTAWWIWARRQAPSCANMQLDGDETGVDCGGSCAACPP